VHRGIEPSSRQMRKLPSWGCILLTEHMTLDRTQLEDTRKAAILHRIPASTERRYPGRRISAPAESIEPKTARERHTFWHHRPKTRANVYIKKIFLCNCSPIARFHSVLEVPLRLRHQRLASIHRQRLETTTQTPEICHGMPHQSEW
jgi:hypothetical protein